MQCGKEKMRKRMKLNVFTVREGIFLIKTPATEKLDCLYCRKKSKNKRKIGFSLRKVV